MPRPRDPLPDIVNLEIEVDRLFMTLSRVSEIALTYEDAHRLHMKLKALRSMIELVRSHKSMLWHSHHDAEMEERRKERARERERRNLAEWDATRAAARYLKQ